MATILIVDDQLYNREYLATLLRYAGYTVIEACDGAEALAIAQAEQPDLVIADVLMPRMDGYEFVRQLRDNPSIAHTQVVYLTAVYLEQEVLRLAKSVDVEHILVKPVEPTLILSTIAEALAQPAQVRAASAGSQASDYFDREHIRLLTDKLAHKVNQLSNVNARLAALLDLGERLASKYDPDDLLQTCCDAACRIIGTRQAMIQILDEEGRVIHDPTIAGADAKEPADLMVDSVLLAQIFRADRPVRNGDTAQSAGIASGQRQGNLFLGVPIGSATQRYGVLYLSDKLDGGEFDREDEQIAVTLAAQTAMAYENAQRYLALRKHAQAFEQEIAERANVEQRLRLYARRLETLHAIDRAILAAHSPQEIAQAALPPIRQLVPCRYASIIGFDLATGEAEVWAAESDLPPELLAGERFRLDELLGSDTMQYGELFVIEDLHAYSRPSALQLRLLEGGIRAYICMPIIVQNAPIGCLAIAADQASMLGPEYQDIAHEVATQLAAAIQNLRLFEQVRIGRERLQRLSQQLVRTQESERRHIARELHDEIGQSLTAAQLNLQILLGISDLNELPERLEDSMQLIDRVLQQVRALSLDLRPSMLDDLGLVPALRWYVNRQAERAGFTAELHMDSNPRHLPPDLETTCFRIAQEALNNIVRYSQAKRVTVELGIHDSLLRLKISDNGVGFDVSDALNRAASGRSLGLVSMQERAVLLGGMIQFESTPDRGTTIDVRLPLDASLEIAQQIERRSRAR